jgi:hypothetical protein
MSRHKNQGLDNVEGSAPAETIEEPASNISVRGAGNVGASTTWDNFAPTVEKENKIFG